MFPAYAVPYHTLLSSACGDCGAFPLAHRASVEPTVRPLNLSCLEVLEEIKCVRLSEISDLLQNHHHQGQ